MSAPFPLEQQWLGALPWPDALHGVLALQAPDSPYANILGWLIVFFMIIWPIIRGAIEAANERRRKFVEQERRRGHAEPSAGPVAPTGRPTLERDPFEALRRAMEQAREDQNRQGEAPPVHRAAPPPPTRVPQPHSVSQPPRVEQPASKRTPARRPKGAPAHQERESRPVVRSDTFGRDPFDEKQLERPLVADVDLARVPSEGGRATETPRRRRLPAATPPMDAPSPVIEPANALEPTLNTLSSRGRAIPVGGFALKRIAQRVPSPWARAVLYEELLGPPIGLREPKF